MRIFVDENIPRITVNYLRERGHEVRDIRGTPDQGLPDPDLWKSVIAEQRLLITTDRGFTEFRNQSHGGLLIVRLRQPNRSRIHQAVLRALAQFSGAEWAGLLVVVRDSVMSISSFPPDPSGRQ